ncbi:paraquat-inducible protein A [Thiothrix litoralis]|jgi:paraquat-inducible protein A|uniref:Paraquat-inducible protein A n=1 Tax=Thiothrix litoralis TaxID=2891210 RepID=A0ABX7WS37_9GAMM|nr:paraquat-inducible protein A [Thiothrix litoralis]QTR46504.1 paraquat-inducible protein A [Thiothrix litoralis]
MSDLPDVACPECGQLHRYRPIAAGKTAYCTFCGETLYRNRPNMVDAVMALTLAGLILFALTNLFPLLGLRAQGQEQEMHLFGASVAFWNQEYRLVAVLIVLNIIVFPLFELLALLVVTLTIRNRWESSFAIFLYRWMREIKPWGMLEIFMLGVLVSVVKLGDVATLIIGTSLWSFAGLIFTMAAASAMLDPFTVWRELDKTRKVKPHEQRI